jgi:hypothetical protein
MDKRTEDILFKSGLILAGYFLILKPVLNRFGITKSAEDIANEKADQKRIEDKIKSEKLLQKQTKTDAEWQIIADQIYQDLRYTAIDDKKDDAVYQAARVKNDTDFWILYKLFGKRQEYAFFFPIGDKQDLPQMLRSNLSLSQINIINDNYRRKNMKSRI